MRGKGWRWFRAAWPAFVALALTIAIWFAIPLPYIVYEPGPTADTAPMVAAEATAAANEASEASDAAGDGGDASEGAFLLTTVRWTYANVFAYVLSHFDPDAELLDKALVTRGASRTDYVQRQRLQMRSSHGDALEAVYRELGVPYEVKTEQIVVFSVLEGLSADGVLRPGDRLLSIDGRPIEREEDVRSALEGKSAGEDVRVTYRRGGDREPEREASLTLRSLPGSDPPRPGMGIAYGLLQTVESVDPAYRAEIQAGSIGGPSAGLMFALELYDRFTDFDYTRGYRVAGTGEISPDGKVGTIGGVAHKVAGAHRSGADVFFVPPGNAEAAKAKAAALGTAMDVVVVSTLREALDYLSSLPPKEMRTGAR